MKLRALLQQSFHNYSLLKSQDCCFFFLFFFTILTGGKKKILTLNDRNWGRICTNHGRVQSQLWPALFWCCNNELVQEALESESLREPRAGRRGDLKKNKKTKQKRDYWQSDALFKQYAWCIYYAPSVNVGPMRLQSIYTSLHHRKV